MKDALALFFASVLVGAMMLLWLAAVAWITVLPAIGLLWSVGWLK